MYYRITGHWQCNQISILEETNRNMEWIFLLTFQPVVKQKCKESTMEMSFLYHSYSPAL